VLYVNLRDGSALTLDLWTEDGENEWTSRADDPAFHTSVRGVSLALDGHRADLPLPRRFRSVRFSAEVIRDGDGRAVAERVSANADGVLLSLTMYLNGRSGRFRVDLDKRGRARFCPGSLR
jgi:hypothetical protein